MIEYWWAFILAAFLCYVTGAMLHIWNMKRLMEKGISYIAMGVTFTLLPAGSICGIVGVVLLILWLVQAN